MICDWMLRGGRRAKSTPTPRRSMVQLAPRWRHQVRQRRTVGHPGKRSRKLETNNKGLEFPKLCSSKRCLKIPPALLVQCGVPDMTPGLAIERIDRTLVSLRISLENTGAEQTRNQFPKLESHAKVWMISVCIKWKRRMNVKSTVNTRKADVELKFASEGFRT